MIFNLILDSLYFVLGLLVIPLSVLPDVAISPNFATSIDTLKPYYASLGVILPVGTIIAIIAIEVVVDGAIFVYKGIKWGYQKIPGIS